MIYKSVNYKDIDSHDRNPKPERTADKERHVNRSIEDCRTIGGHNHHPDPTYKVAGRKYRGDREDHDRNQKNLRDTSHKAIDTANTARIQ